MKMLWKFPLAVCLLILARPLSSFAAETRVERYRENDWEDDIGYRQAVRVGQTLYIAGTPGAGAMPEAIKEAYGKLEKTLKAHGLTFKNVVKENIYTTDIEALKTHSLVRRAFYGKDFPAASWVQVSRLYLPELVIEVELVAVFPE